jgi:hypothetical protein
MWPCFGETGSLHRRRSGPSVAVAWVAPALRVESSGVLSLGTETGVLNEVFRTFPQPTPHPDKCRKAATAYVSIPFSSCSLTIHNVGY